MTPNPTALAAVGLMLMAFAPMLTAGTPIQDTPIGLEGDPGSVVAPMPTDADGQAVFAVGPGRYAVLLPAVQTLRVPAVARVQAGRTVLTSVALQPGGQGRGYFAGRNGQRLIAMIPRGGGRIRVTLTEGPAGPGNASR